LDPLRMAEGHRHLDRPGQPSPVLVVEDEFHCEAAITCPASRAGVRVGQDLAAATSVRGSPLETLLPSSGSAAPAALWVAEAPNVTSAASASAVPATALRLTTTCPDNRLVPPRRPAWGKAERSRRKANDVNRPKVRSGP
jgi:hypothetical protein